MRTTVVTCALVCACGRFQFESTDAPIDVPFGEANRVFATKSTFLGDFGGLAAADGLCQAHADAIPLAGTYLAWLSSSTIDARDRFAGSRGWIRADGAPVADVIDDLLNGKLLNPIDRDAANHPVVGLAWSGTDKSGRYDPDATCNDWNTATGTATAMALTDGALLDVKNQPCGSSLHLLCLGVGHYAAVRPIATPGRIAFVSGPTSISTLDGLDAICQSDAIAAGLAGTFLAAVATQGASAASRFTIDQRPWRRVDGSQVTVDGMSLFDGTDLLSFIDQRADGAYTLTNTWTGAPSPMLAGTNASTCNDWSSTTGSPSLGLAATHVSATFWYDAPGFGCSISAPVICLEQ